MTAATPMLSVRDLHAWYGESHVLHGMTLHVNRGEVVTLLGRNGAGKSTTMRAIMGLMKKRRGSLIYEGRETIALPPHRIARMGIAYCPEHRGIFSRLDVQENLELPPVIGADPLTLDRVQAMFPRLQERRHSPGTKLSGGEQQMLAIARILRTGAKFLLLDEPTEGLAPIIVKQLGEIIGSLRSMGFTVLLVEQNFRFASALADRHYVVEHGRVVDEIASGDLANGSDRIRAYLGV